MKRFTLIFSLLTVLLAGGLAASAGGCDPELYDCDTDAGFDISVRYPLAIMSYDFAEAAIEQFVSDTTTSFITAFLDMDLPDFVVGPWFLDIASEEFWFSNTVVSVVFTISDYTGGAHPNSYYRTFTFDLTAGAEIALADVFAVPNALDTIYPIVRADLLAQMGGDASMLSFIDPGTGTDPANYQNFAVAPGELIFFFPPYQVAPYAAGAFQVSIPFASLPGLLAPPFA